MKILYVAPLPPPITGHSLVSKVLLDELEKKHTVAVVDLSKDSFKEGVDGVKRIMEVLGIIRQVWWKKKKCDKIYLTISESLAGNIKDIFIYMVCFGSLSKMYIHLHGGSIKRLLWDKHPLLAKINKFFIQRMGGVIISGKSHTPVFAGMLPPAKIHIIPNFAQEYIFVSPESITDNFESDIVHILYMSNLIPKKGYNELADAVIGMNEGLRKKIHVDFAGSFESEEPKRIFLNKVKNIPQIQYHGIVDDEAKRTLFAKAHIFCLPTSYFEGQPISILEAYASGCVVVTTGQSGIRDIFTDQVNGYEVEPGSAASICTVLERIVDGNANLKRIALINLSTALERYRESIYTKAVQNVLESYS